MAEEPPVMSISSSTSLNPDEIVRRAFPAARKGVDGDAVRRYLESIADEIRALVEREAQLRRRVYEAERRAAEPPVLDEATLTRAVGAETARVLQTAHDAAHDVMARAEAQATELVAEAEAQAGHRTAVVQEEAAGLLEVAAEEAAVLAASALAEATALQESTQAEAEALLEAAQEDAVALLDTTNQRCRDAVREAQQLRKSVLSDLLARRRALFVQLEQLRSGRDSLVELVDAVGGAVEQLRGRLERAEHDARVAAADAGERAEALVEDDVDTLLDPEIALELRSGLLGADLDIETEIDADVVLVLESDLGAGVDAGDVADVVVLAVTDVEGEEGAADVVVLAVDVEGEEGAADVTASHRSVGELFARLRASRGSEARSGAAREDVAAEVDEAAAAAELAVAEEAAGVEETAEAEEPAAETPAAEAEEAAAADAGAAVADGAGADAAADASTDAAAGADEAAGADAAADASTDAAAGADEAGAIGASAGSEDAAAADDAEAVEADVAGPVVEQATDAAVISKRDALVTPVVTRLARALKRALQDDQNELLNAIRHASGTADLDALLPEEIQRDRYAQAASGALADGWLVGRSWLVAEGAADADDEAVGTLATETGRLLGTELAGELSGLLRHRLTESLRALGDVAEGAQDAAGAAYREWKGARVEGIAGDFATRAFFGGAVAAGEGTIVRWVVDDGRPCPDCDDNALAGEQLAGDEWPTGQLHPPVHPGCRCLLVAITN
jgi:cell division septum initiation protein DivIVA